MLAQVNVYIHLVTMVKYPMPNLIIVPLQLLVVSIVHMNERKSGGQCKHYVDIMMRFWMLDLIPLEVN